MSYAAHALERFNMPIMDFLALTPQIQGVYRFIIDGQIEREKVRQKEYDNIKNSRD